MHQHRVLGAAPNSLQAEAQAAGRLRGEEGEVHTRWQRAGEEVAPLQVEPRKTDVRVTHFGVVWMPYWRLRRGGQIDRTPAFV